MMFPIIEGRSVFSSRKLGTAYLFLALFAGVLGGGLALLGNGLVQAPGQALCHGILMALFVIVPAALGGFGHFFLPESVGAAETSLPLASVASLVLLSAGIVLLPVSPLVALGFWALGSLSAALDVIVTILEFRTVAFGVFSPFVWSLLATACGVVVTAPVLAALVTRIAATVLMADGGHALEPSVESLAVMMRLPQIALIMTPALGLICQLLRPAPKGLCALMAPYAFAVSAVLGPVLWVEGLFVPGTTVFAQGIILGTQVLPALVTLCAVIRDVWSQGQRLDGATFWGMGALFLLTAGWIPSLLEGLSTHNAVAFGGVMAVCGGFYLLLDDVLPGQIPVWLSRGHALVTLLGALCSLTPALRTIGDMVMGVSLLAFVGTAALCGRRAASVYFARSSQISS